MLRLGPFAAANETNRPMTDFVVPLLPLVPRLPPKSETPHAAGFRQSTTGAEASVAHLLLQMFAAFLRIQ